MLYRTIIFKMDINAIEQQIITAVSQSLNVPVVLSLSQTPLPLTQLPPQEQEAISQTKHDRAKNNRLMARHALAQVFKALELPYQHIMFPHPQFSIAHQDNVGIAVATPVAHSFKGIGVDVEPLRLIKETGWKFFLSNEEQAYIKTLSPEDHQKEVIRFWTIKEALYKASPDNKEKGLVVGHFSVHYPQPLSGTASLKDSMMKYRYVSIYNPQIGWVSIALCC